MGRGRVDGGSDVGARGGGTDRRQQVRRYGVHPGRPASVRVGRPRQRRGVRLVGLDRRRGTRDRPIRRRPADVLRRETHVRLPKATVHHAARSPARVPGRFREAARRGKSGASFLTSPPPAPLIQTLEYVHSIVSSFRFITSLCIGNTYTY